MNYYLETEVVVIHELQILNCLSDIHLKVLKNHKQKSSVLLPNT